MKILVTGGAGFIGSNFVRRTIATRPWVAITVVDSLTYAGRISNLDGILNDLEFVHGNIQDRSLINSLVSKVDVVIHFAAESHNDNSLLVPQKFIETNIIGTFELIQACMKHNVHFHHISTDEVFGELALDSKKRFTSESAYKPSSPYSATKAASDHLVRAWVRTFGLRATISNCTNNYGPFQHEEKFIPKTILSIAAGNRPKVYGDGENVRDWIHVDDHIEGIWAVLDKGVIGETYLFGADTQRTNLEVVLRILERMGKPADFIEFVPDRPGHDLRYAIDAAATYEQLDWRPKYTDFESNLVKLIEFYGSPAFK